MTVIYRILSIAAAVALAGCTTTFDQMTLAEKQAFVAKAGADCELFGYRAGTTPYARCIEAAAAENDRRVEEAALAADASQCHSIESPDGTVRTTCY